MANKKKIREAKNIVEKKKNFRNRIKGAIGKMSSFVDNYFNSLSLASSTAALDITP